MRGFADHQAARKEARRIAGWLAKGDAVAAAVSGREAATYGRYLELLRGVGASPELAFTRYVEAVGSQFLHRQSAPYRTQVRRKPAAYERHNQIGLVLQVTVQLMDNAETSWLKDLTCGSGTCCR